METPLTDNQLRSLRRLNAIDHQIPAELKALPRWCVYKTWYSAEKHHLDKIILDAKNGARASRSDPNTWADYKTALMYARKNHCKGLSFATKDSGVTFVDLDKCISSEGLSALAERILGLCCDTYAEKSISGKGIHILARGDVLQNKSYRNWSDGGTLEVYDDAFVSMTGNRLSTAPAKIGTMSDDAIAALRTELGRRVVQTSSTRPSASFGYQSDEEVIARIERSRKGDVFRRLMSGEVMANNATGQPDWSASDMQLLNILAFFTDSDKLQMERIYRASNLYRPNKPNMEKYLQHSINNACASLVKRPDFASRRGAQNHSGK